MKKAFYLLFPFVLFAADIWTVPTDSINNPIEEKPANSTIIKELLLKGLDPSDANLLAKILGYDELLFFSEIGSGCGEHPESYWNRCLFKPNEISGYGDMRGIWHEGSNWTVDQKVTSSKPIPGIKTHLRIPFKSEFKIRPVYICSFSPNNYDVIFIGLAAEDTTYSKNDIISTGYFEFLEVGTFKKLDGFTIKVPILRQILLSDAEILRAITRYKP